MYHKKKRDQKSRVSALVVLIDRTTFVDEQSGKPTPCVVLVIQKETEDNLWRLPRIQIPDHILSKGPQDTATYVQWEVSKQLGFVVDALTFVEEITESERTFFLFTSSVEFYVAVDSAYAAVEAKDVRELHSNEISFFHREIAKRFLLEQP